MSSGTNKTVEERLQEIEDLREIQSVWFKWHHECTGGFRGLQPGRMEALECLAEDATIEIDTLHEPGKGPRGRREYTEFWDFFYGDDGPLPLVFQVSVAEDVHLNGDTAVQKSVMLGIFQARGGEPTIGLTKRTNDFVRTADGWRIAKTTTDGGFSTKVGPLLGQLNKAVEYRPRPEWKYEG